MRLEPPHYRSCAVVLGALLCAFASAYRVPSHYVLLAPEEATFITAQCSRSVPEVEGHWSPDEQHIQELERALPHLAKVEASGCCLIGVHIQHPERYFRQYAGVIIGGRHMIYVNAFPPRTDEDPSWEHEAVVVCDGGDGYWGVLWDPDTKKFEDLAVNGEA